MNVLRNLAVAAFAALVMPGAAAAQSNAITFKSPSGNIFCYGDPDPNNGGVVCEIAQVSTQSYQRQADCGLDQGRSFWVPAVGNTVLVCAGDTISNPGYPVLGYGQNIRIGEYIVCYSEKSGMECQNRRGSGFKLRRAAQTMY